MGHSDIYTAQILQICSDPAGKTLPQVAALCDAARSTINTKLPQLHGAGKLHRAGKRKAYHYFTHQAHALAWQQQQDQAAAAPSAAASQAPRPDPRDRYTAKILQACSVPRGRSLPELVELTRAALGTLGAKLPKLVATGLLHRRGTPRRYRYFNYLAHATAWERAGAPNPLASPETAPTAPARAQGKAKHGPALTIGRRPALDNLPTGGTVTWPAHVRVTVAPTHRDTRFTFDPPPGWRGEFGREWQQKRNCK